MPASKSVRDDDIAVNQAAIKQAEIELQARSLLESLLGGNHSDESPHADGLSGSFPEDDFGDDLGGIGYTKPSEDRGGVGSTHGASASTEKLRKQLLGKRMNFGARRNGVSLPTSASTPRPRPVNRRDESDDEGGRAALGRAVKKKDKAETLRKDSGPDTGLLRSTEADVPTPPLLGTSPHASLEKKRRISYLDQVLAERAAKKKKQRVAS